MSAGKYCNREVIITAADTTIIEAAGLMRKHHVGDLVVVKKQGNENLPIGIVTDRDLVIEILAQAVAPESVMIKDVMNRELVTVSAEEALLDTLALMQARGVRRVLVVNDHAGLEGILSADDAIDLIAEAMNNLVKLVRHELKNEQHDRP